MFAVRPMFAASGVVNPLPGGTFSDSALDPADASISLNFFANGEVYTQGLFFQHNWFQPTTASIGNNYWIRATLTAGTTPSTGTMGAWLQLSTTRSWSNTRTSPGSKTSTMLIEIAADSGGANVVASGTYTITAFVDVL